MDTNLCLKSSMSRSVEMQIGLRKCLPHISSTHVANIFFIFDHSLLFQYVWWIICVFQNIAFPINHYAFLHFITQTNVQLVISKLQWALILLND